MILFLGRFLFLTGATALFGSGIGWGIASYSSTEFSAPSIEASDNIAPNTPVKVYFSTPMYGADYRERIAVSPSEGVFVEWRDDFTTLVFTPKNYWKPQTIYTITLPSGKTRRRGKTPETPISFTTLPYPSVASTSPEDGARAVVIGIEDPIRVEFTRSVKDFFIQFSLDPEEEIIFQNNAEKTWFELLPKHALKEGETYTLTVSARWKDAPESEYRHIKTLSFETLPPPPAEWSRDFGERIEQAKKFTRAKISDGRYIDINLSQQILSLFENGTLINSFLVSSGKRGMDTPVGAYAIHNKAPRPWSRQYELFMPYWMAITPDGKYGIHELPEWPGGYKEGAAHLGTPVSHGCVRLGVGSATSVYEWTEIGTPVIIY